MANCETFSALFSLKLPVTSGGFSTGRSLTREKTLEKLFITGTKKISTDSEKNSVRSVPSKILAENEKRRIFVFSSNERRAFKFGRNSLKFGRNIFKIDQNSFKFGRNNLNFGQKLGFVRKSLTDEFEKILTQETVLV